MIFDKDKKVFRYGEEQWVTCGDLLEALQQVGAADCDVLLLHTAMEFGMPAPGLKRQELAEIVFNTIQQLNVKTLVFPTFSFSFANHEDYDVNRSRSAMGLLNEYVRKREDAVRSLDPLMSVCVVGENKELAEVSGDCSLGKGGFFDRLHHTENVKIAFFGVDEIICNTHLHYVEDYMNVPYRYNLEMSGKIIDADGNVFEDTHKLFVTYKHVTPYVKRDMYDELDAEGKMKKVSAGNASVSCFKEIDLFEKEKEQLEKDVNCFLAEPYDKYPLVKEFEYGGVHEVR